MRSSSEAVAQAKTRSSSEADAVESPLWQRLAWMVGIWLASVTALGTVAMIIRFWLKG